MAADASAGLLVKLRNGADSTSLVPELSRLAQEQDMVLAQVWPQLGIGLLQPKAGTVVGTVAGSGTDRAFSLAARRQAVAQDPAVLFAELDAPVFAADLVMAAQSQEVVFLPQDPRRSEQYALDRIFAYGGWTLNQGSQDVVIAVVDSGFDLLHEDLDEASVWHNTGELTGTLGVDDDGNGYVDDILGWDWVGNDGVTDDPYGHGSHVGGVIAASTDNQIGIASVGRNLRVMPLRILDQYGRGSISGLTSALLYAAEAGARVVNLSLVTTTNSATLHNTIKFLESQGILIVAASGNAGASVTNYYPAAYAETFTVAATDGADTVTLFSNYGDAVDVAAPGSLILSTYKDGSYYLSSGTSMATPHVSALAGLLLSMRPDLTKAGLIDLIRTTADDVNGFNYPGRDNFLGHGRINVRAALEAASAGLELGAGTDHLLPRDTTNGVLHIQANVAANMTASGAPSSGTVVAYTLYPQAGSPTTDALLTGHTLTDGAGVGAISVTVPLTETMYALDLNTGVATATLPVFAYAAPLTITLTTESSEVSAEDTALPFVLEIRDNEGVRVPVPVQVQLTTNIGLFANGSQTMTATIQAGRYEDVLTSWSLMDLLDGALLIDAFMPATGTAAQIRVPVQIYTHYLGPIFNNP